ncbi:MAG: ankyrin repeat domain-containing protein [Acidobacteriota bacterium]|nr:ankyrin repeat domain-containing protein [Acidobacteriota bacterium]
MTTTRRQILSAGTLTAVGAAVGAGLAPAPPARAHLDPACPESQAPPLDSQLFRQAVLEGDEERVLRYLERDPGLAYGRDAQGRSPIVLAFVAGHRSIAELLQRRGVTLDLVEAALLEDWTRVEAVGAVAPGLVNAPQPAGGTALHAAARYGQARNLWRLAQLGADLDARASEAAVFGPAGATPARGALERWSSGAAERTEAVRVVFNLLGNGADVNAAWGRGETLLHAAAELEEDPWVPHLLRFLLRKGADEGARNGEGQTALDLSRSRARSGHRSGARSSEAAEGVLSRAAEVPRDCRTSRFAQDGNGAPYRPSAHEGLSQSLCNQFVGLAHFDLDEVRRHLERQPLLAFVRSSLDELAVEAGAHMGRPDMVDLLLDHGAPLSLPTALMSGRLGAARELLQPDPARIRERGAHDFPLIWYPSMADGDVEAAELLLNAGIDLASEGKLGWTALHWAADAGHEELAAFWIEAGVEINARSWDEGLTALDLAVASESTSLAQLLRARGGRSGEAWER